MDEIAGKSPRIGAAAAVLALILLTGPALASAQPPLRQGVRMVRAEGEVASNLKAALAVLAGAASGLAVSRKAAGETPHSP